MKQTGTIERCLKEQGFAVLPIEGTSMWPLLKEGRDRVQVSSIEGKQLRKGDIVLYRRKDGTWILHRIIKVEKKDTFLVCGDHQWRQIEEVCEQQILAVAQGFFRDGCFIDEKTWWYRLYVIIWNRSFMMRRFCLGFLRLSGLEGRSLK